MEIVYAVVRALIYTGILSLILVGIGMALHGPGDELLRFFDVALTVTERRAARELLAIRLAQAEGEVE